MDDPDLFDVFVHPLHSTGLRYMIVGSVASVHYGEPRFTLDVDLVVHLDEPEIDAIASAFPEPDYYTPPRTIIAEEIRRPIRGHFNVIHLETGLKADFYPTPRDSKMAWAWTNRRHENVEGQPVYFAPPEYVILSKLEFYREGRSDKHVRDIRSMLAISGAKIDLGFIARTAPELGLAEVWRFVQSDRFSSASDP